MAGVRRSALPGAKVNRVDRRRIVMLARWRALLDRRVITPRQRPSAVRACDGAVARYELADRRLDREVYVDAYRRAASLALIAAMSPPEPLNHQRPARRTGRSSR